MSSKLEYQIQAIKKRLQQGKVVNTWAAIGKIRKLEKQIENQKQTTSWQNHLAR